MEDHLDEKRGRRSFLSLAARGDRGEGSAGTKREDQRSAPLGTPTHVFGPGDKEKKSQGVKT